MNKILKLLKNEIIKASRKPFYIVIIALSVVSVIAGAGIMKLALGILDDVTVISDYVDEEEDDSYILESIEKDLEVYREQLAVAFSFYDVSAIDGVYQRMERYDINKKLNLFDVNRQGDFIYSGWVPNESKNSYLFKTVNNLAEMNSREKTLKFFDELIANGAKSTDGLLPEYYFELYPVNEAYRSDYEQILKDKDFSKYIDVENKRVQEDPNRTEQDKAITIENNNLLKSVYLQDLSDEAWKDISSKIATLRYQKVRVANMKSEETGNKLSENEIEEAKQIIAEIELGLKKHAMGYGGSQSENQSLVATSAISFGVQIAGIFAAIMGALLVAEEIQSGSIKALIVAPCTRRKIFTAKLLVLIVAIAFETALLYLAFLLSNLIYGLGASPIVFTFLGKACALNYYVYNLFVIMLNMLDVFMYGIFALMLSTILRNTGGAMSISLVVTQVVTGIVQTICTFFTGQVPLMIVRFIPAVNLGLSSKVFASQASFTSVMGGLDLQSALGSVNSTTWQFSLIYNAVFALLMIFTCYQSFEKRDIK